MRGDILSYDATTETGQISGDDSLRYSFSKADLQGTGDFVPGGRVDFVPSGDQATQIVILAAIPQAAPAPGFSNAGHAPLPAEVGYDWKSALLSFNGRLRRQHFWISFLIIFGLSLVLGWIPILGAIISIALIWPNLAIQVQRLHDMGKSGWLVLIPLAGTIIGLIMMIASIGMVAFTDPAYFENLENEDPAVVLSLLGGMMGGFAVMALVSLGFLLWIGVSDSQRGDNKYGPNPKGQ